MDGYNNDLIKERDTIPLLFELKNKESLLDYELMETFYKTYKNNMSISFLSQGKRVDLDVNRRFKEEEEKYISEGRLEELLNKYKTIGQIDDSTLKVVYEVVSKYINNLTYEDMLNRLSKSPNTIEIVKHLAFINRLSYVYRDEDNNLVNSHKGDLFAFNLFEHELKKFEIMFSKCRFGRMIDYESYSSMTDDEKKELRQEHIKDEKLFAECLTKAENGDSSMRGKVVPHFAADWCNKNHFDYRGLIPSGLAIEAKEGMYKEK